MSDEHTEEYPTGGRLYFDRAAVTDNATPEEVAAASEMMCAAINEAGFPLRIVGRAGNGECATEPPTKAVPDHVWNRAVTLVGGHLGWPLATHNEGAQA